MKNNRGMTLIEIIIIIAILGTALPAILMAFGRIVLTGADAKSVMIANNLAEETIEQVIKNDDFSTLVSSGPASFSGAFSDYNYQIIVDYVNEADLNTPVGPTPTDFKRAEVIITKTNSPNVNIKLSTIITDLD